MATHEKSRKRFPIVGIILLILFLLVAGTAGYLYYSICKAP